MSAFPDMAEAHDRDYAAKNQMDELRRHIDRFLADPPLRAARTLPLLESASRALGEASAKVVRAWD